MYWPKCLFFNTKGACSDTTFLAPHVKIEVGSDAASSLLTQELPTAAEVHHVQFELLLHVLAEVADSHSEVLKKL